MEAQEEGQGTASVKWRPPDGLQLADAAAYKNKIGVLDALTSETTSLARIVGSSVDWSPDGSKLVSGSRDGRNLVNVNRDDNKVYLTDMVTGQEVLALSGHTEDVRDVDWSPDGNELASAGNDNTIRLWDAVSGQLLLTINIPNLATVRWSPDSQKLATTSFDGEAQVWDASTGQLLKRFTHSSGLWAVAWSPDGTQIVYGGDSIDEKEPQVEIVDVQQRPTPILTATSTP